MHSPSIWLVALCALTPEPSQAVYEEDEGMAFRVLSFIDDFLVAMASGRAETM